METDKQFSLMTEQQQLVAKNRKIDEILERCNSPEAAQRLMNIQKENKVKMGEIAEELWNYA